MAISARGRASYQVSPLKWSPRKHLLHGMVDAFSKAIGLGEEGTWGRPCDERRVWSKAVATIHW